MMKKKKASSIIGDVLDCSDVTKPIMLGDKREDLNDPNSLFNDILLFGHGEYFTEHFNKFYDDIVEYDRMVYGYLSYIGTKTSSLLFIYAQQNFYLDYMRFSDIFDGFVQMYEELTRECEKYQKNHHVKVKAEDLFKSVDKLKMIDVALTRIVETFIKTLSFEQIFLIFNVGYDYGHEVLINSSNKQKLWLQHVSLSKEAVKTFYLKMYHDKACSGAIKGRLNMFVFFKNIDDIFEFLIENHINVNSDRFSAKFYTSLKWGLVVANYFDNDVDALKRICNEMRAFEKYPTYYKENKSALLISFFDTMKDHAFIDYMIIKHEEKKMILIDIFNFVINEVINAVDELGTGIFFDDNYLSLAIECIVQDSKIYQYRLNNSFVHRVYYVEFLEKLKGIFTQLFVTFLTKLETSKKTASEKEESVVKVLIGNILLLKTSFIPSEIIEKLVDLIPSYKLPNFTEPMMADIFTDLKRHFKQSYIALYKLLFINYIMADENIEETAQRVEYGSKALAVVANNYNIISKKNETYLVGEKKRELKRESENV